MLAKRTLAIRQRWRAKRRRVETRPVATSAYLLNVLGIHVNTAFPEAWALLCPSWFRSRGPSRLQQGLDSGQLIAQPFTNSQSLYIYIYMSWNMFKNGDAISVRYTFVIFFSYYLGVFFFFFFLAKVCRTILPKGHELGSH